MRPFRQLIRQPALTAGVVLTLGVGLGASLAVFTLVNAILLRPLPYSEPDRIVSIGRGPAGQRQSSSHRDVAFLRDHVRSCAPIAAAVWGAGINVDLDSRVSYQSDRLVSQTYFDVLGVQPTWGRAFTPDEDVPSPPPVVILDERFLRRQGIDPADVVGGPIVLGGRTHTVVGVLSRRHTRPSDPEVYRPLGADSRGGGQNLEVLCRLAADAGLAALNDALAGLTEAARGERLAGDRTRVAYSAMTRHEWEFGALRPSLATLMIAVGLVLLVAAANTMGLLLVRASGRRRELGMRAALGASPGRLARMLIGEHLALASLAGAIGLAAAPLMIRGLLSVAPRYYAEIAEFSIDPAVVAAAAGLSLLTGLAVALAPLVDARRLDLRDSLQEDGRTGTIGRRTAWVRHVLIGAETAVCAVLLVGALLLFRTFVNLMQVETGVDSQGVLTARMSLQGERYDDVAELRRYFEDGVARLARSPSIEAAAVGASLPGERALNLPATFPDSAEPERVRVVNWRYVTPEYFPLLRLRHVAGRAMSDRDRGGAPLIAVVNERFAIESFGGVGEALGRRIIVSRQPPREIVGVVGDTLGWALGDRPRPMMFVPLAQVESDVVRIAHSYFPPRWIVRSAGEPETARRDLESVIRALDPAQPFIEIRSLDAMMIESVGLQRFYLVVLAAFALFAVALAAVGIYAAYAHLVASRTAEIGVRLALGAAPRLILWSVVGRALGVGAIATAIGLAAAAGATRLLRSLLFGVSETDPVSYAIVAVALMGTVLAASLPPAWRAARIDPLAAIRS